MAEILGISTGISTASFFNSNFATTLTWITIIFCVAVGVAIGIFLLYQSRIYRYKVVLFENLGGKGWEPTLKDRARLIKVGDSGEEVLFLRKKKEYKTAYGRKMSKNTYWFAVGQDGYWYNFLLGDLDAKMGMLDIEPIDRDMRYMQVAIRKNAQERYRQVKFMEKYGTLIINGVFLIIMLVGMWFLLDQMAQMSSSNAGSVGAAEKVLESTANIVASLDNICSGGAGIKPV